LKRALLLFLGLSAQSFGAGLDRYSQLIVSDAGATPRGGVRVTYLGTNGYEFQSGEHRLLVDPYFSRAKLSAVVIGSPIQPDLPRIDEGMAKLAPGVDAILVTHGHFDHLLDVPVVMSKTGAHLIASSTAVELAKRAGASASNCHVVTTGALRHIGPWKITALAATHDRVFLIGVPFAGKLKRSGPPKKPSDWVCGEPLSYLIEINGLRIFIDSGGTPALLPPANIAPVDLAILGVALPDSRARFNETVRRLRPRYVLPSHQDNFFRPLGSGFQFGPLTDFPRVRREHERQHLPGRLILLDYFQPWTLPPK
jgi:L-ascorbate metabolism protein UlaG (beta-lactamase superfamily)